MSCWSPAPVSTAPAYYSPISKNTDPEDLIMSNLLKAIKQKKMVFIYNIFTVQKLWNLTKAFLRYYCRMENLKSYPLLIKVDVTPMCQLRCPVCIHGADTGERKKQDFKNKDMSFDLF